MVLAVLDSLCKSSWDYRHVLLLCLAFEKLMCMNVLHAYLDTTCMPDALKEQKRSLGSE